jgi:hypothetical protein
MGGRGPFREYPSSPTASVTGPLEAAVIAFATAWRGADELLSSDATEFETRLTRSARLYAEADESITATARQAA